MGSIEASEEDPVVSIKWNGKRKTVCVHAFKSCPTDSQTVHVLRKLHNEVIIARGGPPAKDEALPSIVVQVHDKDNNRYPLTFQEIFNLVLQSFGKGAATNREANLAAYVVNGIIRLHYEKPTSEVTQTRRASTPLEKVRIGQSCLC